MKLKPEYVGKIAKDDLHSFLRGRLPKWWLPDDIVFVEDIPKTGTGKFDKKLLRERFREYYGGEWRGA